MSGADASRPGPEPRRAARTKRARMHLMQKWAWVYAGLFYFVVLIGYLPGFTDAQGNLLGLFSIQLVDDALHLGSGIWAPLAAWRSAWASTLYFRLFGTVYFLDGIVGLIFGRAYLDGGIFVNGPASLDLLTRIETNLPHIMIGGTAVVLGFIVAP